MATYTTEPYLYEVLLRGTGPGPLTGMHVQMAEAQFLDRGTDDERRLSDDLAAPIEADWACVVSVLSDADKAALRAALDAS